MTDTWFTSHTTLVEFAQWMVTDEIHLLSAQDVVDFFEKPWKYEEEYRTYVEAQEAERLKASSDAPVGIGTLNAKAAWAQGYNTAVADRRK